MTDYHPVTKEELNCKDCINTICSMHGRNASLQTFCSDRMIQQNPDPLALLEAWRKWAVSNVKLSEMWVEETLIINEIHNRPEAVRQQGIKDGWLHD